MKTVQQRLQSRISMRRNYITELESNVADIKANLQCYHQLNNPAGVLYKQGLRLRLKSLRQSLADLRFDQKLDKELYRMVLEDAARLRWYDSLVPAV